VFLVNEAAVRVGNWDNPLEQTMQHWSGETGKVVGVMKDFHLLSLHSAIEPLYVFLDPDNFTWLSVKVKPGNLPATLAHLEEVMEGFSPNFPFEYTFFDQEFAKAYQAEQKMGSVFSSFAILAIVVACLGLFGLSAFTAQQRTREIGIRKVMGASVARITVLLSSEFMRWVIIANLIAWPVAWLVMDRWLQNFALRTSQDPVFFLLSAAAALGIALLTVSVLSVKAAAASPIKALRYE
jgi:putative ABC transport system permease protein